MAGKATAAAKAVRLGVRYAPLAYQAVKQGRAPAQAAVQKAYTRLGSRRQALAHAATLIDGSALRTFAGDDQVWVVFSGDQPVAAHPAIDVPLETLLRHSDLGKRVRPKGSSTGPAERHPQQD